MIFVTLGSQKFQFNRLLKKIDVLVKDGIITEEVFAQTGASYYNPQNYEYKAFLNRDEFASIMDKSSTVITHGGTGAIIGAVKKRKKVIAVPRMAKYGEHVDDHQRQIIEQFDDMNLIYPCVDINELAVAIRDVHLHKYNTYQSNTQTIIASIDDYLTNNK